MCHQSSRNQPTVEIIIVKIIMELSSVYIFLIRPKKKRLTCPLRPTQKSENLGSRFYLFFYFLKYILSKNTKNVAYLTKLCIKSVNLLTVFTKLSYIVLVPQYRKTLDPGLFSENTKYSALTPKTIDVFWVTICV